MNEAMYRADWAVAYPVSEDHAETFKSLKRKLMCNWSWDLFIWDLKELRRLLTKCPVEYNYLYVTRVLSARATYLALNGPFECPQIDIVQGLAERNVQYAGIYRHLFILELDRAKFMRKSAEGGPQDERFFQIAVTTMEGNFRKLLQVLACSDDLNEEFMGHKVGEWIKGRIQNKDGEEVALVSETVAIPVQMEDMRAYRKVQPCKTEMVKKVMRNEPIFTMRERHGRETACDLELERLCRWTLVKGIAALKYGEDRFQYFATMTNESKDTLYLVCADRTLRIKKFGATMPGSMPKAIHTGWTGGHGDVYEVTFDNGVRDVFALSFRAHKEIEKRHIPQSVTRQVNKRGLDMWASESKPPCTTVVIEEPAKLYSLTKESDPAGTKATGKADANGLQPVSVIGDYAALGLPDGTEIKLAGRTKCRAFIRHVHERRVKTGERDFLYQDEVSHLNEKQKAIFIQSGDFKFGLCRTIVKHFDLLFEPLDQALGRYRIKF